MIIKYLKVAPFDSVELKAQGSKFALSNTHVVAEFDGSGLLAAITTLNDKIKTKTNIEFIEYGTRRSGDKSGAYLFLPGMVYLLKGCTLPLNFLCS